MKVTIIVGVRPHFVKLSVLYAPLAKRHQVSVIHTGQHYDLELTDVFFKELKIPPPDRRLSVSYKSHSQFVGTALMNLETHLKELNPDIVLVMGDANSSMVGALAAAQNGYPVGHIEAGARNYIMTMPEEINRLIIDSVSSYFFCPTPLAVERLAERGIYKNVYHSGDLLLDCSLARRDKIQPDILKQFDLPPNEYYIATIHRQDNTSDKTKLKAIIEAIEVISTSSPVLFVAHPKTKLRLSEYNLLDRITTSQKIKLVPPQSYDSMMTLLKYAKFAITDSNGIQRESFFLGTRCVIPRDSTEYPETIQKGCARIVPAVCQEILNSLQDDWNCFFDTSLFGDGTAAEKISSILENCASVTTKSIGENAEQNAL